MPTKIAQETSRELAPQAKAFIAQAIRDIMSDPDFGLELTSGAKKRLARARASKRRVSLAEIKERYY